MSWSSAILRGLAIFVYFVVATVWVPDLAFGWVTNAAGFIQDLVGLVVWGVALVFGMWALRFAQDREII